MQQAGKETEQNVEHVTAWHEHLLEKTEASRTQINTLKREISSMEGDLRSLNSNINNMTVDTEHRVDATSDAKTALTKLTQDIGQANIGITNADQELKQLLNNINTTTRQLNIIEERANRLKTDVKIRRGQGKRLLKSLMG